MHILAGQAALAERDDSLRKHSTTMINVLFLYNLAAHQLRSLFTIIVINAAHSCPSIFTRYLLLITHYFNNVPLSLSPCLLVSPSAGFGNYSRNVRLCLNKKSVSCNVVGKTKYHK